MSKLARVKQACEEVMRRTHAPLPLPRLYSAIGDQTGLTGVELKDMTRKAMRELKDGHVVQCRSGQWSYDRNE